MNKTSNKKSPAANYLSSLSLSHANLSECEVCINEGGRLPIYTFHVTDQIHDWGQIVSLTGPTSPIVIPNTHYMMLLWGLFPRLTTEVVPQGLDTIKTSCKEENTSLMGVQQHTMIIYIKISSDVTNASMLMTQMKILHSFIKETKVYYNN